MREQTQIFTINGRPMPAPDADVVVTCTDVEAMEPVRDQDGLLHRCVIRQGVTDWTFRYGELTEEDRRYLEGLFPEGAGAFHFGHPDPNDITRQTQSLCYRADYTIALGNVQGLWRDCSFRIREV